MFEKYSNKYLTEKLNKKEANLADLLADDVSDYLGDTMDFDEFSSMDQEEKEDVVNNALGKLSDKYYNDGDFDKDLDKLMNRKYQEVTSYIASQLSEGIEIINEAKNTTTEFSKPGNDGDIYFSKREGNAVAVRQGDLLQMIYVYDGEVMLGKVQKTDKRWENMGKPSEKLLVDLKLKNVGGLNTKAIQTEDGKLIYAFLSESVNEAKLSKIYNAAKKGSYPVTLVVTENGKVIKQELVGTPQIVPAAFNQLKKEYPKATVHVESKTGERLFSESVNEASGTIAKGAYSFADYFGIPVSRLKGFKFDGTDDVEELHKVLGRASSNIKGTENIYKASITESVNEGQFSWMTHDPDDLKNFVKESVVNEANEVSKSKIDMMGSRILGKIKIGTTFVTDGGDYTVTGFGPKSNAFQEFDAEKDGKPCKVKLTAMYGVKLEVTDDPRSRVYRKEEKLNSMIFESVVNEAVRVPSNVLEFAKRKGSYATALVKKAAGWAEKAGKYISNGTAIGKNYSTIILDMKHHGSEIYINLDNETIKLFGEEVTDAKSFAKVLATNESVEVNEGQFSWMTHDSDAQIGSEMVNRVHVYMFDNEGNKWEEKRYEGYGEFGGKDYYDLVATMNGYTPEDLKDKALLKKLRIVGKPEMRQIGIALAFDENGVKPRNGKKVLFPALVTDPRYNWKRHDFEKEAETDPNQSWAVEDDYDDDYGYYDESANESWMLPRFESFVNENENRVYGMFTDDQGKPGKLDKELLDIALKGLPSNIVKNIDAVEANGYGKSSAISPPTVSNKGQSRGEIEYHKIGIGLLKPMGRNKITAITLGLRKRTSGPGTGYLYMKVAPDWRHTLGPDAEGAIEFWDDPATTLNKLYNEKFKNWF